MVDVPFTLARTVGETIVGIRRMHYVFQGVTDESGGPLEVTLDGGGVFWLDAGPDGEVLKVKWERWEDPFLEPMTPVNREFVATSGKWTAFDVSDVAPYSAFVGATVHGAMPVSLPNGKVVGVIFETSAGVLRADVEADELYVRFD